MKTSKEKPAGFTKVKSKYKGATAYKPNEAMQRLIVKDLTKAGIDLNLFPEWKKLLEQKP